MSRRATHIAAIAVPLLLGACAPVIDQRGNLIRADRLAEVAIGMGKPEVTQILGSPGIVSTFDPRVWIYAGERTAQTAFFSPEREESQTVIVRFDDQERVAEVVRRGEDSRKAVPLTDRETPTVGHSFGLMEQLFGNIGRFSNANSGGRGGPRGIPGGVPR